MSELKITNSEWRMANSVESHPMVRARGVAACSQRLSTLDIIRNLLLLLLLLTLMAACGGPEPQPLTLQAAPWQSGESSTYDITDLNGQFAGTTIYSIQKSTATQAGNWIVRRETEAQGNSEIVEVEITGDHLRPRQTNWALTDGSGTETIVANYAQGVVDMQLTSKQSQMHTEQRTIPTDSYDAYTLMILLRAMPLAKNYATQMNIFTALTGNLEQALVRVRGTEQIESDAGAFDTWRVEIKIGESKTQAWIGTNTPYPVVKYIDGRNGGTYLLSTFEAGK
ncbi:MAG: DUF3108 domain-containing protein [Caldilineaceae bacterium]